MLDVATGDLLLVRFSPMNVEKLLQQAKDQADYCESLGEERVYSISTFGLVKSDDDVIEDLVARICKEAPCRGRTIWLVTASTLREEGYDAHLSEPPPHHYDVILGKELHLTDVERVVELFEHGRETNPAWRTR